MVNGIVYKRPVSGGYGNLEEFLATLVENIYRSEKNRPPLDYHGHPIDARSFLNFPSLRALIVPFRSKQRALYFALAKIQTSFNPIREFGLPFLGTTVTRSKRGSAPRARTRGRVTDWIITRLVVTYEH
jgi:hypothetical protein